MGYKCVLGLAGTCHKNVMLYGHAYLTFQLTNFISLILNRWSLLTADAVHDLNPSNSGVQRNPDNRLVVTDGLNITYVRSKLTTNHPRLFPRYLWGMGKMYIQRKGRGKGREAGQGEVLCTEKDTSSIFKFGIHVCLLLWGDYSYHEGCIFSL